MLILMVNYKGRRENLVSLGDRPIAERKAIARAGGIASGQRRRESARFRKNLKICFDVFCDDDFIKELEREISAVIDDAEQSMNND